MAWSVWSAVVDQVVPLRPHDPESEMRMDFAAVKWCMDVHEIPLREQLPTWRLVSMLHHVRWHRERTVGEFCQAHAWDTDSDEFWNASCPRCLRTFGLNDGAAS